MHQANSVCAYKSGQNIFEIAFRFSRFHLIIKYEQRYSNMNNPEIIRQGPLKQINGIALNELKLGRITYVLQNG